jgi:SET domain-containing protein
MGKFSEASGRTTIGVSSTHRDDYVYVAPSGFLQKNNIDGNGLYASQAYKKGDIIIEYIGKKISLRQANEKLHHRQYMFDVRDKDKIVHVIDAANSNISSAAKYVNTTLKFRSKDRNAEFIQHNKRIWLKATKKIKQDDEIIAYYGEDTLGVIGEK